MILRVNTTACCNGGLTVKNGFVFAFCGGAGRPLRAGAAAGGVLNGRRSKTHVALPGTSVCVVNMLLAPPAHAHQARPPQCCAVRHYCWPSSSELPQFPRTLYSAFLNQIAALPLSPHVDRSSGKCDELRCNLMNVVDAQHTGEAEKLSIGEARVDVRLQGNLPYQSWRRVSPPSHIRFPIIPQRQPQ